ncbi:MAG: hypothetical protein GX282_03565, partial [Campylobacteraceae bacterium]|nr:hypothetical protein [Campylobacteraceae bacterium]
MAMGLNAKASGQDSTAIGQSSQAAYRSDLAIGLESVANQSKDDGLNQTQGGSTAIGVQSHALGSQAAALGSRAVAFKAQATAIGNDTIAYERGAVSIGGDDSGVYNDKSLGTGEYAGKVYSGNSSHTWRPTFSGDKGATAISAHSQALTQGSTAIGVGATAGYGKHVGNKESHMDVGTMKVYKWDPSDAIEATSIGAKSWAMMAQSTALGASARGLGAQSTAVGYSAKSEGKGSVSIGDSAYAKSTGSVAIGGQWDTGEKDAKNNPIMQVAKAEGANTVALGAGAQAKDDNSIALGSGSVADRKDYKGKIYDPFTVLDKSSLPDPNDKTADGYATWYSTKSAVSVGAGEYKDANKDVYVSKETRQITNVAAGSADTDAVNVAQLRMAQKASTTRFYSVNNSDSTAGNYNNDGAQGANSLAAGVNTYTNMGTTTVIGSSSSATDTDTTTDTADHPLAGHTFGSSTLVGHSNTLEDASKIVVLGDANEVYGNKL